MFVVHSEVLAVFGVSLSLGGICVFYVGLLFIVTFFKLYLFRCINCIYLDSLLRSIGRFNCDINY